MSGVGGEGQRPLHRETASGSSWVKELCVSSLEGEKVRIRENLAGTQRERGGYREGVTKRRGEKQIRKEQTKILRENSLKEVGRGEM